MFKEKGLSYNEMEKFLDSIDTSELLNETKNKKNSKIHTKKSKTKGMKKSKSSKRSISES